MPHAFDRKMVASFEARLADGGEHGCWLWTGAGSSGGGYGYFRRQLAHRFSYELHVAPIPDGLTIDHLCRVRTCVNPDHLDPVPLSVNVRRAWNGQPEFGIACRKRHPATPENLLWRESRWRGTYAACRTCEEDREAAWAATAERNRAREEAVARRRQARMLARRMRNLVAKRAAVQ
jgi:HNH endonuclease